MTSDARGVRKGSPRMHGQIGKPIGEPTKLQGSARLPMET